MLTLRAFIYWFILFGGLVSSMLPVCFKITPATHAILPVTIKQQRSMQTNVRDVFTGIDATCIITITARKQHVYYMGYKIFDNRAHFY